MRIVLIGASSVAIATAPILLSRNNEVVIVDEDKLKIDTLTETLDCGFLHGDGSRPAILKEVGPSRTDVLICLTDDDQANILASLVAHSLGFKRIVTKIEDADYQHLCAELELDDIIIPDTNTAATLADLVSGKESTNLSSAIRGEARFFTFVARQEDEGPVSAISLPKDAAIVLVYHHEETLFVDAESKVTANDEVVILTHSRNIQELEARWRTTV